MQKDSLEKLLGANKAQRDSIARLYASLIDKNKIIENQRLLLDKKNKNLNSENEMLKFKLQGFEKSENKEIKSNIEDAKIKAKTQIENNNTNRK